MFFVVLAIPLMRRRVPPNDWYGLRVAATFADESVWYDANAGSGRDLLVLGLAQIVVSLAPAVVRMRAETYATANIAFLLIGTLAFAVIGIRRARLLLKARQASASVVERR